MRFGPGTRFQLPTAHEGASFYEVTSTFGSRQYTYTRLPHFTRDMTGDGFVDLVVIADFDAEMGEPRWQVYPGSTTGFTSEPLLFSLPAGFGGRAFRTWERAHPHCTGGENEPAFLLRDVTADGLPDLVVVAACDYPEVGTSKWLVFRNSGSHFELNPLMLQLPPGHGPQAFASVGGSFCVEEDQPRHELIDMTGDRLPDLVLTSSCVDESIGRTHWLVYRNERTGFAPVPLRYTLPEVLRWAESGYHPLLRHTLSPFDYEYEAAMCPDWSTRVAYELTELTGDNQPDLVITYACLEPEIGTSHWLIFPNTGTSFEAKPVKFTLPPGFGERAFLDVTGKWSMCWRNVRLLHVTREMTGDALDDLLITRTCGGEDEPSAAWRIFPNTGQGFRTNPEPLPLPASDGLGRFAAANSEEAHCPDSPEQTGPRMWHSHSLMDLDGDKLPEIVITQDCSDPNVGLTHWLVHPSSCERE